MRRNLFILLVFLGLAQSSGPVRAAERVIRVDSFPITIRYSEGDERVADKVAAIAVDEIPRLSGELGLVEMRPIRILLVPDMRSFKRAQDIDLPDWGVAFALMTNQIMLVDVKRASNAWNSLEKIVSHELSHLLVAQRVGEIAIPVWFLEGLALWQAREWSLIENWRLMEAVWSNHAPGLAQIYVSIPRDETNARNAYRVAYAGFTNRFDDQMERVPLFVDEIVRSGDFGAAFEVFWGETEQEYYARFSRLLNDKYRSRLLIFQTGPLFTMMAFLFLFVILRIYIRNRQKLRRMEDLDGDWSLDDS